MIPQAVKVAGITYQTKEIDGLTYDHNLYGQVIYKTSIIKIDSGLSPEKKEQVFVHELFHAILHEAGYDEHDEEMVRRVSNVLYQVLKDNELRFSQQNERILEKNY
jgi:Zn-dependent peptidase ImmA (M78 family)